MTNGIVREHRNEFLLLRYPSFFNPLNKLPIETFIVFVIIIPPPRLLMLVVSGNLEILWTFAASKVVIIYAEYERRITLISGHDLLYSPDVLVFVAVWKRNAFIVIEAGFHER